MKKLAILSIVAILLLSGCTSKVDDKSGNQSTVVNNSLIKTDTPQNGTDTDIEKIDVSKEGSRTLNTGDNDWCVSDAKISANGKEYIVVGITTYGDHDNVCKAEMPIQGGSAVIYFNKEYVNKESGAYFAENATSSGPNAHSEAKVSVVITGTGK
jgi:Tfp pilus assembly protein PilX